jgi:hypothetical protein
VTFPATASSTSRIRHSPPRGMSSYSGRAGTPLISIARVISRAMSSYTLADASAACVDRSLFNFRCHFGEHGCGTKKTLFPRRWGVHGVTFEARPDTQNRTAVSVTEGCPQPANESIDYTTTVIKHLSSVMFRQGHLQKRVEDELRQWFAFFLSTELGHTSPK